ncbi:super-infection exclusion protein B [Aestuariivirga sp.]|uniref:super-infection exclusion protein B n=1 Tax=Aestuariivirga sp. TaxID=2650926 RepID=UPI0039E22050
MGDWLKFLEMKYNVVAGVFLACLIALFFLSPSEFRAQPGWVHPAIELLAVLSGSLTAMNIFKFGADKSKTWLQNRSLDQKKQLALQSTFAYLETLSEEEYTILACLVTRNQQSFNAKLVEPKIQTLLQKRLLIRANGAANFFNVAYMVPDAVWAELKRRSEEFVYAGNDKPWTSHAPY